MQNNIKCTLREGHGSNGKFDIQFYIHFSLHLLAVVITPAIPAI